ncbi:hypothetical protein AA0113_g12503 [Alternaria arborescens]|uniref:BTB domain-containing protein n=2 Tax=Alternaria sect. Alternaria TaxID=2499237 RepID=A0A4Q4MZ96_ALTAL|nr:hypothetical protein AA0117_g12931 [Alternaria alternata]RYO26410.1 hypothetical protein AA0113_g12503 [Alternaria arborescens]RYO48284.1 hypothetical protein AA0116_g12764 [Alternaria tenuissima]
MANNDILGNSKQAGRTVMQQADEASSSTENDPNHATLLDSEGDAVLRCVGSSSEVRIQFRVSTAVLRLASSVFSNMFKPSFHEGQRLLHEDCPEFELEDDAQLMGLLLSILHYRGNSSDYTMSAEKLARLSILCDKYDCTGALGPWIPAWFRHAMGVEHPTHELGNIPESDPSIDPEVLSRVGEGRNVLNTSLPCNRVNSWANSADLGRLRN